MTPQPPLRSNARFNRGLKSSGWLDLLTFALDSVSRRPMMHFMRMIVVVYVYMLVLLPSGSLLGLNVKVMCFLLLLPVAAQVSISSGQMTAGRLVSLLSIPAIFLLWSFLSIFYGFQTSEALAQYRELLVTMTTCWFAAVFCADDQNDTLFFLRTVLYAEFSASLLKILLLCYAFVRGIPVTQLIDLIHTLFGVQLMTFDLENAFGRLEFFSDNIIPICIFAILCYRHILGMRSGRALFMIFVLVVSDLFSFSRYLWGFTVLAILLGLIVGRKDRFQVALLAALAVLTLISLPFLVALITLRFSETVITGSDAERVAQISALRVFIADAPWFGHGLGTYTRRLIRNPDAPYSYEAQLLALFGQIGLVGIGYLCLLTISYYRRLWPSAERSGLRRAGMLMLLLAWFAGGFLNPSVISSPAAISYCALYAMAALKDGRPTGRSRREESSRMVAGTGS